MPEKTETYPNLYDGLLRVRPSECLHKNCTNCKSDPCHIYEENEATYYHGEIAFSVSGTHKLAKSCPTIVIAIPTPMLLGSTQEDESLAALAAEIEAARSEVPHLATPLAIAAADHCLRTFTPYIDALNEPLENCKRTDVENGKFYLATPGSTVCLRNSAYFAFVEPKWYRSISNLSVQELPEGKPPQICLCIRMQVQLPFHKLRIATKMLCRDLPYALDAFLAEFDRKALARTLKLAQTRQEIRAWLAQSDCCAFIADGSILPRKSGTDEPMVNALPFVSPPNHAVTVAGVRGMGLKRGVNVITGGGYSGKSTVLDALAAGIYDHAAGDGRELCLTDPSAVTITAEDGRSVQNLNISPFLQWLPTGDPHDFSTAHASGSTSQAANIMEAIDSGSMLLLIDEDKSATNFMIRDMRMKALIAHEPITPFTDRVQELAKRGVSTVLVIGGSGEYLAVADRILCMEEFVMHDVTDSARALCTEPLSAPPKPADWSQHRSLRAHRFTAVPQGSGSEHLAIESLGFLRMGDEAVDLRDLGNLASAEQTEALAFCLRTLTMQNTAEEIDLSAKIDALFTRIQVEGLDVVWSSYFTTCSRFLAMPRKFELLATVARMRSVRFVSSTDVPETAEQARMRRFAAWMRGETPAK